MHLTYPSDSGKSERVELKGSAGAPVREIEITDEMIEAGAEVLDLKLSHDPFMSQSFARGLVEEILRVVVAHVPAKIR